MEWEQDQQGDRPCSAQSLLLSFALFCSPLLSFALLCSHLLSFALLCSLLLSDSPLLSFALPCSPLLQPLRKKTDWPNQFARISDLNYPIEAGAGASQHRCVAVGVSLINMSMQSCTCVHTHRVRTPSFFWSFVAETARPRA